MPVKFDLSSEIRMMSLTSTFYEALDSRDYEQVVSCFAPDGIWWRRGQAVKGLSAIQEALRSRPENFHTCHIVSNVRVLSLSEDEGAVRFYMTGHPFHGDIEKGVYEPIPEPHIIALYEDKMKKVNGVWKISEKKILRTAFKNDMVLP